LWRFRALWKGARWRERARGDRVAVVSDQDWMRPAMRALSFLLLGKASFRMVRLPEAKPSASAEAAVLG
jgi:hypothetical protein